MNGNFSENAKRTQVWIKPLSTYVVTAATGVVRAPFVAVTTAGVVTAARFVLGTVIVRVEVDNELELELELELLDETLDGVSGDKMLGMLTERLLLLLDGVSGDKMLGMLTERLLLLLDEELLLELELGEEVLELGEEVLELLLLLLELELGEEVLELLLLELLDEEKPLELELDEELLLELLDEDRLLELLLELELGEVVIVLVEGRLGTLMDELMGIVPLPVHTPLQATIAPLTH